MVCSSFASFANADFIANALEEKGVTNALEDAVDSLDTAGIIVKDALEFNNKF